ncbi:MAG: nitronate monooxygenase [Gammaproteobacteria bacterium]|nr:MAG: nitronate monooxygenase [Gammaproteobacteria bacterium]RKZ70799.1 MAG: nitronate monooxygenase [Gammaproteobacteria bacterium]
MTEFSRSLGIQYPVICGAMYPCSNPELVAAASEAGGIGIIQPLSLSYVHGYEFREGLKYIRSLTDKPLGINFILETSSKRYVERTRQWLDIALEEGIQFFVTALGNPRWVVDIAKSSEVIIYHDVTERKWAEKAFDAGVDGFICVNNRAGGHAGRLSAEQLYADISTLGKPLICAGGISQGRDYQAMLKLGYAGIQMGTRFIAASECTAHDDYKQAIIKANEEDIVLTDKISGAPVSIIKTPFIEKIGTKANALSRWLLRNNRTKHWMRTFYTLQSIWKLKKAAMQGMNYKDYFQAGKSVAGIDKIISTEKIIEQITSIS